jgi:hypothetical protein
VPVGIFPKLPEERSTLLFTAKEVRGTIILKCLRKGKEMLRVGEKEFPGETQVITDHPCCPGQSCPKAVLEHWKQEVTSNLGPQKP